MISSARPATRARAHRWAKRRRRCRPPCAARCPGRCGRARASWCGGAATIDGGLRGLRKSALARLHPPSLRRLAQIRDERARAANDGGGDASSRLRRAKVQGGSWLRLTSSAASSSTSSSAQSGVASCACRRPSAPLVASNDRRRLEFMPIADRLLWRALLLALRFNRDRNADALAGIARDRLHADVGALALCGRLPPCILRRRLPPRTHLTARQPACNRSACLYDLGHGVDWRGAAGPRAGRRRRRRR